MFATILRPPRAGALLTGILLLATSGALRSGERDIIVSEIHYNPLGGNPLDEFIEIHNRGPTAVDVSHWAFTEGISVVLAPGTALEPEAFLVLSPDPARARSLLGISGVHDRPFTGRLDNDGEILALRDASGELITRLHYGDEGIWPSRPDGSGPTLETLDPWAPPDIDRSWGASRNIFGTPGRRNSRWTTDSELDSAVLRAASDPWRYRKGTQEPAQPLGAWTARSFSDGSWAAAPGGFGYGGGQGVSTLLDDMQGSYSTVYIRADFDLDAQEVADVSSGLKSLSLRVGYDDAYVAYVNGQEVRRANAGTPGIPLFATTLADDTGGGQALIDLRGATLFSGRNVVAIQGLNHTLASGDFLIEAEVTLADVAASGGASEFPVELNEVEPSRPGNMGSIELYNESVAAVALPAHALIDSLGNRYEIPSQTIVPGLGRLSVPGAQPGWQVAQGPATYVLVEEDGESGDDLFVTSLEAPSTPQGRSFGRYPDGNDDTYVLDAPTPGSPNQYTRSDAIVVNEIHFHPPFVSPGGGCVADCSDGRQWIEVHNRSGGAVSLGGWTLSKAVDFTFPAISIPSGGYIVVASSRTVFLAQHPGFDSSKVVGDWVRDLAHDTDTINLNDALGNRVDHVKYSDGKPLNDDEPEDGIDDRTFAGSTWPSTADGTGRTIELVNPGLDNRLGAAWAAGPQGGTPGAANASFAPAPQGCVDEVEHSPGVPAPSDPVTVTCRVGSVQAVDTVEVLWHREGGASGTVPLRDDGLSGDGRALNGIYGGTIPAQPEGSIIGFQVRLRLADGKVTLVPRTPPIAPYGGFEGPYFLYQVLSATALTNSSANYHVVMRPADAAELASRSVDSNVLLPCTFIEIEPDGSANVKHLAGIRYRGDATRNDSRKPYRVAFPSENAFRDIKRLNLNSAQAENEMIVSDLFRRAGLPYPQEWMVNLTFQGSTDPGYARKERMDGDFTSRFFGGASDSGSFYRAIDPSDLPFQGDLEYHGQDPDDYIPYYEKRRDTENPDYSDIIELCRAFDPAETPDSEFPDRIEELIDPVEWARYFALQSLISNNDGSIQTGTGEDYLLYRVPATSNRPDAGKWLLVPWDIEESFTDSAERLFRSSLPSVRRFLLHPRFMPLYYEGLTVFRTGVFSRQEMRRSSYPLVQFLIGAAQVETLDAYVRERSAFVEAEFPLELSASPLGAQGELVIAPGESWRYWKGTAAPAGAALAWTGRSYSESGWLTGQTGIGYGDGDDATLLLDMENAYTSVYARKSFDLPSASDADGMRLDIVYDDGFVLYLNGFEVTRRNVSGTPGVAVPFDGTATNGREPGAPETIDLTSSLNRLVNGTNVFSFHVLNQAIDSSDLSFIPELTITGLGGGGGGCGLIYASGATLRLQGTSHAFLTRSVLVNGDLAAWDVASSTWTATVALVPGENAFLVESYPAEGGLGSPFASETVIVRRIDRDPVNAQGTLPAGLTRWTAAGGPYFLGSRVTVPAGARLELDPGTVVLGAGDAGILVRGEIRALGTAQSPITLLPAACSAPWGGIAIEATGTGAAAVTHLLQNVRIDGASGAAGSGALSVTGSKLRVESSSIEGHGPALTADQSVVTLLDSSFSVASGMSDVIRVTGAGQMRSTIERCRIEGGPDDGISLAQASADLRENFVAGTAAAGISISGDGPLGGAILERNVVHGCGTGISISGGAHVTGNHCTIAGNDVGLLLERRGGSPDGGHADLHSAIIWSNTEDVSVDAASSAVFAFSDIGGALWPGTGNISAHPRFIDYLQPNYGLRASSPCIGTGTDGTDMGALDFEGSASEFIRMDADGSGTVNVTDAILVLDFLFRSGAPPACMDAADGNDDGEVDLSDPISVLFYLFRGGITPPAPFPAPGLDPTVDGLSC